MAKSTINPVFILGANRNGTTWLGNILIEKFEIFSTHHFLHFGILESDIYGFYKYFGPLNSVEKRKLMLKDYGKSDYFQLLNLDIEQFENLDFTNFFEFYFEIMDLACEKSSKSYWTTKLSPRLFSDPKALKLFFSLLYARYNKVFFIGIKRNFNDYLKSILGLSISIDSRNQKKTNVVVQSIKSTLRYQFTYQIVDDILAKNNGILIRFEDLKTQSGKQFNTISNYLNLKILSNDFRAIHPTNSTKHLSAKYRAVPKWLIGWFNFLKAFPFFSKQLAIISEAFRRLIYQPKAQYFERLKKLKQSKNDLILEFEHAGHIEMVQFLKEKSDEI